MVSGIPGDFRFILASKSPRRRQLLSEAGLIFDVVHVDFDESYPGTLTGAGIAEYLSLNKALRLRSDLADNKTIVITADTVVWCNNMLLDKPVSREDAFKIIRMISGATHEVITGVTLLSKKNDVTFSETTKVTFDMLTDEEIYFYIDNFNPYDKAGAYGIQEWIGITGNSFIEGSYFNVMGLPVNRVIKELRKFVKIIN